MKLKVAALIAAVAVMAPPMYARDDVQTYSIEIIKAQPEYAEKIGDFQFVFGDSVSGQQLGTTSSRRSTNGINKSDERACAWAALSALIALKNDAVSTGGSSVHGLKSKVTGAVFSSATEFQCISGFTNSKVFFEGVVVK